MRAKIFVRLIVVSIALLFLLYEVKPDFVFSLPGESEQIDVTQEALYAQCYSFRDKQLHDTAFATIDNPDVQKEFINTSRARARDACREKFPQLLVTVRQPLAIKIFAIKPRYW